MRKIPAPYTDPTPLFRHGGAPRTSSGPLLDFSASINPLGPPESVLRVLRNELPSIAHYPDPDCRELTERLATLHGVEPSQIVVGNGSNELIYAIARAFQPKRVAIAEPTYTEYLRASLAVGAKVDHWLAEEYHFKPEQFDPEGADLIWLCNPTNPSGQTWPRAWALAEWMQQFPETLFVVDEAFLPFVDEEEERSLIPKIHEVSNVIVLRSMTKYYALPGLRLGYAVSGAAPLHRLKQHLASWSVNALAQTAGIAALGDKEYVQKTSDWLRNTPLHLHRDLCSLSSELSSFGAYANFMLCRWRDRRAVKLAGALASHGIIIRAAGNFVGLNGQYFRVAVRKPRENKLLLNHLAALVCGGDA